MKMIEEDGIISYRREWIKLNMMRTPGSEPHMRCLVLLLNA